MPAWRTECRVTLVATLSTPTTNGLSPVPGPSAHRPPWLLAIVAAIVTGALGALLGASLGGSSPVVAPASESATGAGMAGIPGMENGAAAAPPGAGPKAVYISAARQQLIGVRTGIVERQRVEGIVRTVGALSYDETRVAQIHTKVSGWVERLFVDYVGKPVRRGQPLFSVYSPDLVTAQADYLIALRSQKQMNGSVIPEAKVGADALLSASRDRLRRWDIPDAQVTALEQTGTPSRTLTLVSPFDGVVLEKSAFAGQYITPDMASFKLADLSSIWVIGQAFEYEAARFRPGDVIDVEFPYGQADKLSATIDFIYPEVDPQTRRIRFRATLQNTDRKLKPDTYVSLVWRGEAVDRVMVPKEAVIDTGERKYVLLALANGYFEPRDVKLAPPVGDYYPVASGVVEGERVVTSAQFLVDSETNLMAAMQGMSMGMPGMDMGNPKEKGKPAAPAKPAAPVAPAAPPSSTHDSMPGMKMPPAPPVASARDPTLPPPVPAATHRHGEPDRK